MGKTWDTPDNSLMHNNVFYRNECVRPEHCSSELIGFKTAYNNLFIECRNIGFWRKDNDGAHDHNAYVNSGGNHGEAHAVTGDSRLVGPFPTDTIGDGFAMCAAFKLSARSICQNAGIAIPQAGDRDFFGNQLPAGNPDIGAHQFSGGRGRTGEKPLRLCP
jgi:hypothetical protein